MANLSQETAFEIAYAYRELEVAEKLLADIKKARRDRAAPDIRDSFGRLRDGLELGVTSGDNGKRLFAVPWSLAVPVIETHIAGLRATIATLSEKARLELESAQEGKPT